MKPHIAILGLGAMGQRMAHKLLAASYPVTVYNRSRERTHVLAEAGADVAESARVAAQAADIVISMVTDDDASRALWLDPDAGALSGLKADAIAIESSTVTPAWAGSLAEEVRARGGHFLDAPVVGSRPQAEAGALAFLVGGEAEVVARARPVIEPMAGAIHHVGATGAGATMKLAVNALFAVQVAVYGEILGMLDRAGGARESAAELLAAMPITSPALKRILGLMTSRSFAPNFPIALVEKDLRYALTTAAAHGAQIPTVGCAREVYARAQESGYGGDDIAGVAQLFE